MNITTKYEIGNIVYAVHPCQVISNGQVILDEGTLLHMEHEGADQGYFHADDIYIVSPHEVRNITVSCNKGLKTNIQYELSGGVIRPEKELFSSFESAAEYAATLYGKASGKYDGVPGKNTRGSILKEIVCKKLQHTLKAVLSREQLERFGEEFTIATQGLVFKEV